MGGTWWGTDSYKYVGGERRREEGGRREDGDARDRRRESKREGGRDLIFFLLGLWGDSTVQQFRSDSYRRLLSLQTSWHGYGC